MKKGDVTNLPYSRSYTSFTFELLYSQSLQVYKWYEITSFLFIDEIYYALLSSYNIQKGVVFYVMRIFKPDQSNTD